jgi:hypothetical protein
MHVLFRMLFKEKIDLFTSNISIESYFFNDTRLIATRRSSNVLIASNTTPKPPRPRNRTCSYSSVYLHEIHIQKKTYVNSHLIYT